MQASGSFPELSDNYKGKGNRSKGKPMAKPKPPAPSVVLPPPQMPQMPQMPQTPKTIDKPKPPTPPVMLPPAARSGKVPFGSPRTSNPEPAPSQPRSPMEGGPRKPRKAFPGGSAFRARIARNSTY